MVEFKFTQEQRDLAMTEGLRRRQFGKEHKCKGRNRAPTEGAGLREMDLIGAAAEVAVAAYLDAEDFLFPDKAPIRGSCDLPGIDVKCRSRHKYDLLVQIDDDLSKTYVLVTIENRKTYIHGYILGVEVPKLGSIKEFVPGRSCYVVPKANLRPIDELKSTYNPRR